MSASSGNPSPGHVATNEFVGVFGAADSQGALEALSVDPIWSDTRVSFGATEVGHDRTGSVVVGGEILIDGAEEWRRELDLPGATHHALFADLYARFGDDVGRRVFGMYAVAIWDRRIRRLLLIRDGAGARTIYYTTKGGTVWFANRLRSIRRAPAVYGELSLPALRDYLICAFVPGTQTLWRDVHEAPPAAILDLTEPSQPKPRTYWRLVERDPGPEATLQRQAAELRPILETAVRDVLPATGPVGVFLSGGVDSSLVTALAARFAPGSVHSYAIHFGPQHPNELEYSDLVARHCGTAHRVLELPASLIQENLFATMAALDDPIGDPLTVPNFLLGRAAAEDCQIVLNGEGGDPAFGGPKNQPMLLHALYEGGSRESAYLRSFQKCYDDLPRLLGAETSRMLEGADPPEHLVSPYFDDPTMTQFLNRLMHINVRLKGCDQILTKVNNLTSANGVIGRSPLADPRVIESSFGIAAKFKLAGSDEKMVLKRAVADLLPTAIITRPKSGMMVPVQRWFKGPMRAFARDLLLERDSRIGRYLNRDLISEWFEYRKGLWTRHGVKIWLVLSLEVWLRANER